MVVWTSDLPLPFSVGNVWDGRGCHGTSPLHTNRPMVHCMYVADTVAVCIISFASISYCNSKLK